MRVLLWRDASGTTRSEATARQPLTSTVRREAAASGDLTAFAGLCVTCASSRRAWHSRWRCRRSSCELRRPGWRDEFIADRVMH